MHIHAKYVQNNIDKIPFKVVQTKSLAMHITSQKLQQIKLIYLRWQIYNIFKEHDLYFT